MTITITMTMTMLFFIYVTKMGFLIDVLAKKVEKLEIVPFYTKCGYKFAQYVF
jgi:hypothetical protein